MAIPTDQVLCLSVPQEIEGPGGGVAEQVGGQAAVEGSDVGRAFVCEDAAQDAEGGAENSGRAAGVDLQPSFDDVEGVDDYG